METLARGRTTPRLVTAGRVDRCASPAGRVGRGRSRLARARVGVTTSHSRPASTPGAYATPRSSSQAGISRPRASFAIVDTRRSRTPRSARPISSLSGAGVAGSGTGAVSGTTMIVRDGASKLACGRRRDDAGRSGSVTHITFHRFRLSHRAPRVGCGGVAGPDPSPALDGSTRNHRSSSPAMTVLMAMIVCTTPARGRSRGAVEKECPQQPVHTL
jgi:hypothetical protein